MRIIFAGTPPFAAHALQALADAGHDIALVLTQPDRPAGRGMKLNASAVKQLAQRLGLPVLQPVSLKSTEVQAQLAVAGSGAEVMVVAAYGLILPPAVLALPRYGCLNIHASLLPRWRGAAPIARAILAGDTETGITIMQMDAGLDTGAMLLREPLAISPDDTSQSLHDKLAHLGAAAIVTTLARLPTGQLAPEPQDDRQATYAAKLDKAEAQIDWSLSADEIDRRIRAYYPAPGAWARLGETLIKIWQAAPLANFVGQQGAPGEIIAIGRDGISVACGGGVLRLQVLQKAGGKKLAAAEFVAGFDVRKGMCFETWRDVLATDYQK